MISKSSCSDFMHFYLIFDRIELRIYYDSINNLFILKAFKNSASFSVKFVLIYTTARFIFPVLHGVLYGTCLDIIIYCIQQILHKMYLYLEMWYLNIWTQFSYSLTYHAHFPLTINILQLHWIYLQNDSIRIGLRPTIVELKS